MMPSGIAQYTDRQIVTAILGRNTIVTEEFLYKECYPVFKSLYNKYYTDCENCKEFINEIYLYILTPTKKTGRSKLADFRFECSLKAWLYYVSKNYCRALFEKKIVIDKDVAVGNDRSLDESDSFELEIMNINKRDVEQVLRSMRNVRFQKLLKHRYLEEKSNNETALLLGVTMSNYYNMHLRAKEMFIDALRKEGLI